MDANTLSPANPLPIPHRIAGFALTATSFILVILGLAHHNFRGEIVGSQTASASVTEGALRSQSYFAVEHQQDEVPTITEMVNLPAADKDEAAESYFVFLQKFPLESSFKMIFHTEVIVCPRTTFSGDTAFLNTLDGILSTLAPSKFDNNGLQEEDDATSKSPFASIEKAQWSKQSEPGCVQLGYGGASCGSGCCGSPHKHKNTNYPLNSNQAVISNAMGEFKELYLYGISGSAADNGSAAKRGEGDMSGISGEDAYKAVCHGHMNAIEMGGLPKCVSNWAGRDYNPLTNNCNTYTSAVLKCVYGLSDAKPHLGVSDMRTVNCPSVKEGEGKMDENICVIPTNQESLGLGEDEVDEKALSFQ